MEIRELAEKYKLTKDDFWNLKKGAVSVWIIKHDACEKIASIEKIKIEKIKVLNSEWNFCRLLIIASKGEVKVMTIGEALLNTDEGIKQTAKGTTKKGNCESQYIGSMAEKRGVDRAVLKLIDAYQYGIYSDAEADSFEKKDYQKE